MNFSAIFKYNPNHEPAGSPRGGQFTSGDDSGGDVAPKGVMDQRPTLEEAKSKLGKIRLRHQMNTMDESTGKQDYNRKLKEGSVLRPVYQKDESPYSGKSFVRMRWGVFEGDQLVGVIHRRNDGKLEFNESHSWSTDYNAVKKLEEVFKYNPNHEPAGSPRGGQFAPKDSDMPSHVSRFYDEKRGRVRLPQGFQTNDSNYADKVKAKEWLREKGWDYDPQSHSYYSKRDSATIEGSVKDKWKSPPKAGLGEAIDRALDPVKWDDAGNFTKSLGIERKDMPQIRVADQEEFLKFAEGKGVAVVREKVPVASLKPTQKHFNPQQVAQMTSASLDYPMMVSADNHLLDGTNRFVRILMDTPDKAVSVIRIGLPAKEAIVLMKSFPKVGYKDVSQIGATKKADVSNADLEVAGKKNPDQRHYRRRQMKLDQIFKGDLPGHPFHGNQYTDGDSGSGESRSETNSTSNKPALRFHYNGIKGPDGKLQKAHYSMGELTNYPKGTISIYGRDYKSFGKDVQANFDVRNDTDTQTDYFANDTIRVTPDHPMYKQVLAAYQQSQERGRRRKMDIADLEKVFKFNPYHDERGRFAEGPAGDATGGGSRGSGGGGKVPRDTSVPAKDSGPGDSNFQISYGSGKPLHTFSVDDKDKKMWAAHAQRQEVLNRMAGHNPKITLPGESSPGVKDIPRAAHEGDLTVSDREKVMGMLSRTEFTSPDHMPHEAAPLIREMPLPKGIDSKTINAIHVGREEIIRNLSAGNHQSFEKGSPGDKGMQGEGGMKNPPPSISSNKPSGPRPIHEIAREIRRVWSKQGKGVNYAAKPYLEAMGSLSTTKDNYIQDSGESVVAYFLANATSFRGPDAKRLKDELKTHLKRKSDSGFFSFMRGGIGL